MHYISAPRSQVVQKADGPGLKLRKADLWDFDSRCWSFWATTLPLEEGEDIEYITEPELIDEKFGEKVDLIIDGGTGGIEPSTVINCCDDVPEIVRQGKGILNE